MQRSNFTSHVKHVHLKIKKYTCDQCGYSAAYNNGLLQHIRHVHNITWNYRNFIMVEIKTPVAAEATPTEVEKKTEHKVEKEAVVEKATQE